MPTTPSPSAMIVSNPLRSAMWCACHGVPPIRFSASSGPRHLDSDHHREQDEGDTHRIVDDGDGDPSDLRDGDGGGVGQAGGLRSGSCFAARSHWITIATRITT